MLLDRANCSQCLATDSVYYSDLRDVVQCHYCGVIYKDSDLGKRAADNVDPITWCEETQPEMCAEFKRVQQLQYELMCKKQMDYGPLNISMGTQLRNLKEIRAALLGVIVRANDKMQRLVNLVVINQNDPQNENIEDTFMDLANYSLIALLIKNGKWGK